MLGTVALAAFALAAIIVPACSLLWTAATATRTAPGGPVSDQVLAHPHWMLYASSGAWAGSIACGATLIAWPMAWSARRRPGLLLVCMVPLTMPSYLAYAALNLIRSPGTALGDWTQHMAAAGWTDLPMIAGRLLAGAGLLAWTWPIALLCLMPSVRAVSDEALDQLSMDSPSWSHRITTRAAMCRGGLLAAIAGVSLVVLGSPVPLHVAQVPTASMAVWVGLVQDPGNPRHWLTGWPLLFIAAVAAAALSRWLCSPSPHAAQAMPRQRTRVTDAWTALILAASTLGLLLLFVFKLHEWASIPRFIRVASEAVVESVAVGFIVAAACSLLACTLWFLTSGNHNRGKHWALVQRALLGVFCAALLCPGVMLGAAIGRAFNTPTLAPLADSPIPLLIAHIARYAAITMIICMVVRRHESPDLDDAAQLDGADTIRGFFSTRIRPALWHLAGAFALTASLSIHDIDSSIMVLAPGSQSLAERMLGYLHFAKTEELTAGSIVFELAALVAGVAALAIMALRSRTRPNEAT